MSAPKADAKAIFLAALECEGAEALSRFLDQACGADASLRQRVEELLQANRDALGFLGGGGNPEATLDKPAASPGTVIGPYKLLEQIGEGGFGIVFMAEQVEPVRRSVALKVIKPGMDTRQVIARFEAERQALALMDHPHIAKVLDAGETATGQPYFVMELVRGTPITQYCDENHLPVRERLEVFASVCQAIQHAHTKGIIHRDIKPTNVLVTRLDGQPVVKVIDFGVVKAIGQQLTDKTLFTEFAQMVGTPLYMSPEQAELSGTDIDTRSDIYSLGVLLYELLTGTTPVGKEQVKQAAFDEIRRIIREEEPPKPSTRLSGLSRLGPARAASAGPPSDASLASIAAVRSTEPAKLTRLVRGELDWIVMKALEKDRNRRYESASAFAADTQRYLDNEPVAAGPPSRWYRIRKFGRRYKAALGAASVVLAAILAGTALATWQAVRATRAERDALTALQAEKKAKATAQEREAEIRAVLDFVENNVFAAARPHGQEGGLGRDVTLRQAIEKSLPFVEGSFVNQPLIEASLRMTVGNSFWHLGESRIAEEHYQKARTLYTKHLGPNHINTMRSMHNLANCNLDLGRHAEAARLHEETLALRTSTLGPDHADVVLSMHSLANCYHKLGRETDALRLREEVRRVRKEKLGLNHSATLSSMHNLANSYHALGRYTDALLLHEETLALRKATLGSDHPGILSSMGDLARSYSALGRHDDALKLREESLALRKTLLGPDHPDTWLSMQNLAVSYANLGRNDDARQLDEQTLALRKAKLGPHHPDTLRSMNNLANNYHALGRKADALRLHEESLPLQKARLGPDHPDTLRTMHNLAVSYAGLGRQDEALRLREETLVLRKARLGADHPDTLRSMLNLGFSYAALARHEEALKLHEETLALRKARLGPDHPDTLRSIQGVADSLVQLDRGGEAVPLIDDAVQRAAVEVVNPELVPGLMDLRLKHFAKLNDAVGCRATAQMWEKLGRTDADSLYTAARMRAVASAVTKEDMKTPPADADQLAKVEAGLAIDWLRTAIAAGHKDAERLKNDPDLKDLQTLDDFKQLVAELEVGEDKRMQ